MYITDKASTLHYDWPLEIARWRADPQPLGGVLKARQLIEAASFGPDALKVIYQAFDEAWQCIKGNFGESPQDIEVARLRLANAILSVAREQGAIDTATLKNVALQKMALSCRGHTTSS